MLLLARALVGAASDVLRLLGSFLRCSKSIRAENLVLRKQLARPGSHAGWWNALGYIFMAASIALFIVAGFRKGGS